MEEWTTVRYLHAQGKSIREIARELSVARQTVRSALAAESWSRTRRRCASCTLASSSSARAFCESCRRRAMAVGARRSTPTCAGRQVPLTEKATVRFETATGQPAQFDWSPYTVELGGELRRVIVFGMALGYLRRKHYTVSMDER